MKKALLLIMFVAFAGCGESKKTDQVAEQPQPTIQELEANNPMNYIEFVSYNQDVNFWGSETEFEVIIKNIAKHTVYKDLHIKIDWLTNTGKELRTWGHIDKGTYQPNHTYKIEFEKGKAPELGKKFRIRLVEAKVAGQI